MRHVLRIALALSLSAAISACNTTEPFERPFVWHPTGANEANLAAMLVNPADLAHGRGMGPSDGIGAAAAVTRLHNDRVKPLIGTSGTAAAASSGTAAAGN